jgi:micrococcal nuclease
MFEYRVKEVPYIVDGDTVDVVIDLGFSMTTKQRVRLSGIDAPETNSVDLMERQLALEAKKFVTEWFATARNIHIATIKDDKYGRMLAVFHADGNTESLNDCLVRLGYAWAYDGGTRNKNLQLLLEKRSSAS